LVREDPAEVRACARRGGAKCASVAELLETIPFDDWKNRTTKPRLHCEKSCSPRVHRGPKGVINTSSHAVRANQQMLGRSLALLEEPAAGDRDWLRVEPYFAASHSTCCSQRRHAVIDAAADARAGGDHGAPPEENRADNVFNVPRGVRSSVPFLGETRAQAATFQPARRAVFYAAAALPQNLWSASSAGAERKKGVRLAMLSAGARPNPRRSASSVHSSCSAPPSSGRRSPDAS